MLNPASTKRSSNSDARAASTVQPNTFPPNTSGVTSSLELPSLRFSIVGIRLFLEIGFPALGAPIAGLDTKIQSWRYSAGKRGGATILDRSQVLGADPAELWPDRWRACPHYWTTTRHGFSPRLFRFSFMVAEICFRILRLACKLCLVTCSVSFKDAMRLCTERLNSLTLKLLLFASSSGTRRPVSGTKNKCESEQRKIPTQSTVRLIATVVREWKLTRLSPQTGQTNPVSENVSSVVTAVRGICIPTC